MNLQDVSDAFDLQASPEPLSGGSQPTFKVGNVVLKRVKEPSLENNRSPELIQWIAEFSQTLKQDGFRFPRHFKPQHIRAFDQMLLRASLRMLLVMHVLGDFEDWETCSEKQAAELVINYMQEEKR